MHRAEKPIIAGVHALSPLPLKVLFYVSRPLPPFFVF